MRTGSFVGAGRSIFLSPRLLSQPGSRVRPVVEVRIVLGAVASRPVESERAAALLRGNQLSDALIEEAAAVASEVAKPMDNTDFELTWRKSMVRVPRQ